MPDSAIIIQLSIMETALLASMVFLPAAALVIPTFLQKMKNRKQGERNWSIPALDNHADLDSFFHNWNPAARIAALFLYCFLIVSLKTLACSTVALIISILAFHASKLPWLRSRQRLAAMSGFLTMFLIVIPFTSREHPGATVLIFPMLSGFPFHLDGFFLALTIVVKACAIAMLMEPMLGTSSLSVTLQAFARLGVPAAIIQMILLSHRYIFVFHQELARMQRSMKVRGFTAGTNVLTLKTMGNFFGMLFVRSCDRTQKVYEAMLCRGYQGTLPSLYTWRVNGRDVAKGGMWILIGALLLLIDRASFFPSL